MGGGGVILYIITSGEAVWFDQFFEEFVGSGHFVQIICIRREPELQHTTFLFRNIQNSTCLCNYYQKKKNIT